MTDAVKTALADLLRTVQKIRERTIATAVHHQDGDFFTFTMPGVSPSDRPSIQTPLPAPDSER
jgi:hypothetical protein